MATDAKELCAVVVLTTEGGEPFGATAEDGGGDSHGLYVGDGARAAV